jgi:hypothetical protein
MREKGKCFKSLMKMKNRGQIRNQIKKRKEARMAQRVLKNQVKIQARKVLLEILHKKEFKASKMASNVLKMKSLILWKTSFHASLFAVSVANITNATQS